MTGLTAMVKSDGAFSSISFFFRLYFFILSLISSFAFKKRQKKKTDHQTRTCAVPERTCENSFDKRFRALQANRLRIRQKPEKPNFVNADTHVFGIGLF